MSRPPRQHTNRLAELELRLSEAEETLRAIRQGEVDALVVTGVEGDQVYTLQGAEKPYRILIEEMNEGALLLLPDGTILYANARFAQMVGRPLEQVIGASWPDLFLRTEQPQAKALLHHTTQGGAKAELHLQLGETARRPVGISLASMKREGVEGYSVVVTDLTERHKADIQIEGELPLVLGNHAALTQVFSNLLGNAVKFVTPGTIPRVRLRRAYRSADQESVRLTVAICPGVDRG